MSEIAICLAGNPNSGKTTVFNQLTGAKQKVGNWPGVTVEKKEGEFVYQSKRIKVIDLPGTYSLSAYSLDERIARDFLVKERPAVTVVIVDATNLERNLYLAIELLEMGANLVIDLNMMDMVKKKGWKVDVDTLSQILQTPIVSTIATKGEGLETLRQVILKATHHPSKILEINYGEAEKTIDELIKFIKEKGNKSFHVPARWLAIKLLENDAQVKKWIKDLPNGMDIINEADRLRNFLEEKLGDIETYFIERRYGFIAGLVKRCVYKPVTVEQRISFSDKIDKIVLNRYLGIPIFLFFMWLTFQLVFSIGNPFADYIDAFFGFLGGKAAHFLGNNWFSSLISEGIIAGVGSVLVFLPNIMILFLAIGILEDCGYMARAAFVMDRLMHALGLHGKSFIPMILGFGCNIPGIMATRTLESKKDRILTILINPFMSCSARLPIYVLFAGTFFPKKAGMVIFSLYILGIAVAIFTAILFKKLFFRGEVAPLIMELPPYRMPTFKSVVFQMWQRSSLFLKKAGTIILAGVVLVWLLASIPFGAEYASEKSLIGRLGSFFAPIFSPSGFGFWQAAVALIFGILAKEVVVGTLGTLYGVEEEGLRKILSH